MLILSRKNLIFGYIISLQDIYKEDKRIKVVKQ